MLEFSKFRKHEFLIFAFLNSQRFSRFEEILVLYNTNIFVSQTVVFLDFLQTQKLSTLKKSLWNLYFRTTKLTVTHYTTLEILSIFLMNVGSPLEVLKFRKDARESKEIDSKNPSRPGAETNATRKSGKLRR